MGKKVEVIELGLNGDYIGIIRGFVLRNDTEGLNMYVASLLKEQRQKTLEEVLHQLEEAQIVENGSSVVVREMLSKLTTK